MAGFRKAARSDQKLRMAIQGASGSGKTRSALEIAKYLAGPGGQIALIDTERSAALYASDVPFDIDDDFGPVGKENYNQEVFKRKLMAAAEAGYKVAVIDSATHLWKGPGGFLSQIDAISKAAQARGGKYDSFAAWKTVDPLYMNFMQFVRALPMHVIFCVRAKQQYEKQTGANGKGSLVKVGMEPEYRDGFEFEFDIQCAIDMEHTMVPLKHRLGDVLDGKVFNKPGKDFAELCLGWLSSGAAEVVDAEIAAKIQEKAKPAPAPTPKPAPVAAKPPVETPEPAAVDVNDGPPPPVPDEGETNQGYVPGDPPEEPAPTTERQPEVPVKDIVSSFLVKIEAAATMGDLATIRSEVRVALADKLITMAEYNNVLSPAYAAKNKALKAAA